MTRFGYIATAILALLVASAIWLAPHQATRFAVQTERLMAGLELHETEAAGFTIPYLRGGNGPILVLLHGFSADKDHFTRIARHLKDDFTLVLPDLPGFGDADAPPDANYSAQAQVARITAFLDALEIDDPVHLGGSSMGGYLAAATALAAPERVASLWLLAPGGLAGDTRSEVRQRFQTTGDIALLPENTDDFARVLDLVFFEPPWLPGFVRRTLAERAVARHDHHARLFRQYAAAPPLNERIDELAVPLLLVWGERDRVLHPSGAEVVRAALPQAEIILQPDIGHLPMIEAPEQNAKLLLDFHRRHFGA